MAYKRILTIQDISCVGQCSMTVALPVLSACGHETCILPTALLSTHTGGFGKPAVTHLDGALADIWHHWQRNEITFDAILVGYLGSVGAIEATIAILDALLAPGGYAIVDPVMADNGKLYAGFDMEYVHAMKRLCKRADIILPNITEAALLSGNSYQENKEDAYMRQLLAGLEHPCVILTGASQEQGKTGAILCDHGNMRWYVQELQNGSFHGTGDLFAACFTGALMQGKSVYDAVCIAGEFTGRCIANTLENTAHWYGIKFEPILPQLMQLLNVQL